MLKLGVIGYGARVGGVIEGNLLGQCQIAAITDLNEQRVKNRLKEKGVDTDSIRFFTDAEDMFNHCELDGILIGTRCSTHAELAAKVIRRGIPLFLEKPVAISLEDLQMLRDVLLEHPLMAGKVVVSFPLRLTTIIRKIKEIVDSGRIGTVEHVEATTAVPYGSIYYHNWYRDESETHGLFLQKATHDFDYISYILGQNPVMISAMKSKRVFTGDKPAGLECSVCDESHTCLESPQNLAKAGEQSYGSYCSFAVDTGNEDSGSALIEYESGMHVSYTQVFYARKKAAKRGARFYGYKGTIEFLFDTGEIKVYLHHSSTVETYQFGTENDHFGGDAALAENFIAVMTGTKLSEVTLNSGIMSALICLKANESAATKTFQAINWPDF
ncbi:Gfo/Idh/MocA family protein [Paenibacillus nasutitermitis]|uniref:Gfo/Idh/MocA family oxidoreductase n=1 Tax=Paenibacillus nasutitermitis TaxID=1652958 RepID=A0A916ZGM7_9BACL|nr:Gfo/Idh/MocA family oxidoreductase [Paenibacillus nasutitermitis]GGD96759.1 hypothetical protein GCM10010911_64410 [Paenibacillus nasutitermitis]